MASRLRQNRGRPRRPGQLDTSRHTVIYFGNLAIGARGLYTIIVTHLGGTPSFHRYALIPQAADALATEAAVHFHIAEP